MPKSARALREKFLECHHIWTASNYPQGIRSGKAGKASKKRSKALMDLVRCEQKIRTAPKGKLRIVQTGAHDRVPTQYGDYADEAAVKKAFMQMLVAQYREMEVYDDKGKKVAISLD